MLGHASLSTTQRVSSIAIDPLRQRLDGARIMAGMVRGRLRALLVAALVGGCADSPGTADTSGSEDEGPGPEACGDGVAVPGVFCFEEVEAFGPGSDLSYYTATPLGDGRVLLLGENYGVLAVLEVRDRLPIVAVTFTLPPFSDDSPPHVFVPVVAELDGDPGPEAIASIGRWVYLLDIGSDSIDLIELLDTGLTTRLVAIDIDGDGLDEAVGANADFQAWKVTREWPWDKSQIVMPRPPCNARRKVVADFDGDGAEDLIAIASTDLFPGCGDTVDDTYVLLNRFAARGGGDPFDVTLGPSIGFSPDAMAAADMDGDGAVDLAIVSGGLPALVLRGDGHGAFEGPLDLGFTPGGSAAVGDFDGDGSADIVAPDPSGSTDVLAFRRSADGFVVAHEVPQQYEVLAATDLNGDGVDDIVFRSHPPKVLLSDP